MGLISNLIVKKATESVIKTVGKTAVSTTAGILHEVDKHKTKNDASNQAVNVETVKKFRAPKINECIGDHYLKVRASLISFGFKDVSFIEIKDLKKGWFTKNGEVSEISINGTTEYTSRTKFTENDIVVVSYHTFKDGYGNSSSASSDNISGQAALPLVSNTLNYCPNCGNKLGSGSNYCSACGCKLN